MYVDPPSLTTCFGKYVAAEAHTPTYSIPPVNVSHVAVLVGTVFVLSDNAIKVCGPYFTTSFF